MRDEGKRVKRHHLAASLSQQVSVKETGERRVNFFFNGHCQRQPLDSKTDSLFSIFLVYKASFDTDCPLTTASSGDDRPADLPQQ